MQLLDLGDDELTSIFKEVDTKTSMQLMLVCKRFETLIGQSLCFYRNFTLKLTDEFFDDPAIDNMRRIYGNVLIDGHFNSESDNFEQILKFFEKISPKMETLKIRNANVGDSTILKFLRNADNLKVLKLDSLCIPRSDIFLVLMGGMKVRMPVEDFDAITATMPVSIQEFSFIGDGTAEPIVFQRIFKKQEKLRVLKLIAITGMSDFEFSKKNCYIQDITFGSVKFLEKKGADNFTKFMKQQKDLVELKLHVHGLTSGNLAEILSLKSLKSLLYRDGNNFKLEEWTFQNPSVDCLTFEGLPTSIDYRKLLHPFPNITRLTLNYGIGDTLGMILEEKEIDLTVLNSLKLTHLSLGHATNKMFDQLNLKHLRGLKIEYRNQAVYNYDGDVDDIPDAFINFIKRHQQLELFHSWFGFPAEYLEFVFKNLPKLKDLKFSLTNEDPEQKQEEIQLIKMVHDKMEDLSMKFYCKGRDEELENMIPGLMEIEERKDDKYILKIVKDSGKKKVSSNDPIMISTIRPGPGSGVVTINGVFEWDSY